MHLAGSINAVGMLSKLRHRIISSGVQYALSCSITYSCFCDILGKIHACSCKETLGTYQSIITNISQLYLFFQLLIIIVPSFHKILIVTLGWSSNLFWLQNSTLQHYTLYQPSDLIECVKDLHRLCCNSQSSSLPAIREKYSLHKVIYNTEFHGICVKFCLILWFKVLMFDCLHLTLVQMCCQEVLPSIDTSRLLPQPRLIDRHIYASNECSNVPLGWLSSHQPSCYQPRCPVLLQEITIALSVIFFFF